MNHTAIINIARKELGIEEEDYRDLLGRVTGQTSLRVMSDSQKHAVIDELKRLGFKPKQGNRRPRAARSDVRYCHVLWRLLAEAGHVRVRGATGLNAFIRSRFEGKWGHVPIDIDTMQNAAEINAVIRALKDMCRRNGIAFE
ncbi:regulatory protein GemA [Salipiger abyssi]|uniref:Putative DUF1018 protein n=1 Tax=Salipiger abyssi TaxID=1250539 RepID=A0A1P8UXL3_9RHOB|nr:regulatory protein GemA [Salipiger abyssi]ALF02123.1 hypothetical protein vBPeaSP1_032 [Pelagibaca phage vB_PeaS-P1]APZ54138.1 putative DUF1018 protein [Salipiger abyssi]